MEFYKLGFFVMLTMLIATTFLLTYSNEVRVKALQKELREEQMSHQMERQLLEEMVHEYEQRYIDLLENTEAQEI